MGERRESIYEYVVAADVVATLGSAGILATECEIARQAVEHERAQWVVDGIYSELERRRAVLADRQGQLTSELHQVEADVALIDNLREPKKADNLIPELIELYDKQVIYNTRESIAKNQEPFRLLTQPDRYTTSVDGIPLGCVSTWVDSHKDELLEIYGKRIASNISRSAATIDRNFIWKLKSDDPVTHEWLGYDKSSASPELIISNPNQFFEYLCNGRNSFSHKSIVATLCLAEFQKRTNQ